MFAVRGDPESGILTIRSLTSSGSTRKIIRNPYRRMYADHTALIIVGYDIYGHSVIKSVPDQDIACIDAAHSLIARHMYHRQLGLIDDRLFKIDYITRNTITLWDTSTPSARPTNLCDTTGDAEPTLLTACWRSHTWVVTHEQWGAQHSCSRELCTMVRMDTSPSTGAEQIATGHRLYGYVWDEISRREFITALDPRETNDAKEVYSDGAEWSLRDFRDVPAGIAVAVMTGGRSDPRLVTVFDERACAMIGTDIFLQKGEHLFCTHADTIEIDT